MESQEQTRSHSAKIRETLARNLRSRILQYQLISSLAICFHRTLVYSFSVNGFFELPCCARSWSISIRSLETKFVRLQRLEYYSILLNAIKLKLLMIY